MIRKFTVGLLVISMVSIWAPKVDAHYVFVSGRLIYHSLLCDWALKGVPNTINTPALAECVADVAVVEILCENPKNHQIAPGRSATQIVLVGQNRITENNITGKGKASVQVEVSDDPLLNPEFCVNPNWHPILALVREVTIVFNSYDCTNDACTSKVLASTAQLECELPAQYTLFNPPVPNVTEYVCEQTSSQHLR